MSFKPPSVGGTVEISELETLAKGSLVVGDGSGAPSTLAVGTDGYTIVANSGQPTGLAYSDVEKLDESKGHYIDPAGTRSQGLVDTLVDEIQTTDATQTTLSTLGLLDARNYNLIATVSAVQSTGAARASYVIAGCFYRTAAGSATQQGTTTVLFSAESSAAWDATFTVSGNTVRVSVTGAAATTINWVGTIRYLNVTEA